MTDLDGTRQVDNLADSASLRGAVNPINAHLLTADPDGKYVPEVKVAQAATQFRGECTWLKVSTDSGHHITVDLSAKQTRQLRDLLDEVLELQGEKE